jgi:dienelactone hydrolase
MSLDSYRLPYDRKRLLLLGATWFFSSRESLAGNDRLVLAVHENVSMRTWHTRTTSWIVAVALALVGLPDAVVTAQAPAKIAVTGQSIVANLYLPTCQSKCPVVLLVGGSGGGIDWQDYMGAILARHGFAALALAYFGMEGLPKELDQIPLEYFQSALAYTRSHRSLDSGKIGIAGNSKGAELALLLASQDPAIRAVVAFAPSSVVWESLPSDVARNRAAAGQPRHSSWTYKGQPFSFVPYVAASPSDSGADTYRRALEQRELVERAVIRVESIRAPILLLSGRQDTTWPSSLMAEMVVERLQNRAFGFSYEHIAYDDAGHMIAWKRTDVPATRRGGTEQGNRVAQDDAERRMLEFFGRHLASSR